MELWIRSQDKKSLRIVSNINIILENGKWFICNYTGIANIKLGKYESEKRALEVLDEIQNKMKEIYILEHCKLPKNSCYEQSLAMTDFNIYEMPKK